jgi:hypothetical protein
MTLRLSPGLALAFVACSSTSQVADDALPDPVPPGSQPPSSSDAGSQTQDATATPPPPPPADDQVVRFAAIGDQGKGNAGQSQVAAAIEAKCKKDGCDFVQLLGDNIYDTGVSSTTDPQWQDKFEKPYQNIQLPFYVVLGNHDYGGGGTGNEFGKGQFEIDYTNVSQKWKLPAAYYHRVEKHVEFFALDSNMQMYGQDAQQKADVKQWIAASTATWKIALAHHPYLSNGPHGNAGSYDGLPFIPVANGKGVKDFDDEVICGKVDLLLTAHDHVRQWMTDKCKGTELIVSGAGSSPTELKGSNPTYHQSATIGFYYFRIEGRKLTAESIAADGTLDYSRTITK